MYLWTSDIYPVIATPVPSVYHSGATVGSTLKFTATELAYIPAASTLRLPMLLLGLDF
jgi:hypothetical protein